ncbi:hypothetical protein, partial [Pseudomonas aeruginosa]
EDQSTPAQALGLEDAVRSAYRGERCTYVLNSGPIAIFAKQARVKGERGWMATISTTSSPFAIAVLEVAVDDKGAVRVLSVDMAIGCGPQINPGGSALSLKVAPSWV